MFTPEWYLALACQGCVALAAVLVAVTVARIPLSTALLGALFFNSIPVMRAPGFRTELFIHDLVLPLMLLLLAVRFARMPRGGLFLIATLAIFLWPLIGVLIGLSYRAGGYSWVAFIYRRFGLLLFLLVGAAALPKLRVRDLFDTYVLVWIGMAIVGLFQYFGFINVDFSLADVSGESIIESGTAQRGFLGLRRNATGIISAVMLAYCLAHFLLARDIGLVRAVIYALAVPLSVAVLLFCGSRTGLAAALGGIGYLGLAMLPRVRHLRPGRAVVLGTLVAASVLYVVAPAFTTVRERLEEVRRGAGALGGRLEVHMKILEYSVDHAEAAVIGMGFGSAVFKERLSVRLSHAHSEYFEVLWCSGWPGLILYLALIYRLFTGIKPRPGPELDVLSIATRAMFVVGLVAGLAVGNLLFSSPSLLAYRTCMLLFYGAAYRRGRERAAEARAARTLAGPSYEPAVS